MVWETRTPPGARPEAGSEPLVDLGADYGLPPDPEPWSPRGGHRLRRIRLALPFVLVLLLLGASVPVAPTVSELSRIPVGGDVMAIVDGPALYVYDIEHGRDRLAAYRVDDGSVLWSEPASELATEATMMLAGRVVVVSMIDVSASGPHTEAFDTRTGRHLWSSDRGMAGVTSSGDVLLQHTEGLTPFAATKATFEVRDPVTGGLRWAEDQGTTCLSRIATDAGGRDTGVIELCPEESALRRRDVATGVLGPVRHVPLLIPSGEPDLMVEHRFFQQQLIVAGDVVLVAHANAPTPTIDAYDALTLAPLWGGLPLIDGQNIEQCGTQLCLAGNFGGVYVFDLRTGHRLGASASSEGGVAPGRLVLTGRARTGRLIPTPIQVITPGRQAGFTDVKPESLWLQRWDPGPAAPVTGRDPAGPNVIDVLHGVGRDSCAAWARTMVCGVVDRHLIVYRLP